MFYLANLGSEVGRLVAACEQGDRERCRGALARALGIFDELAAMPLRPSDAESRHKDLDGELQSKATPHAAGAESIADSSDRWAEL